MGLTNPIENIGPKPSDIAEPLKEAVRNGEGSEAQRLMAEIPVQQWNQLIKESKKVTSQVEAYSPDLPKVYLEESDDTKAQKATLKAGTVDEKGVRHEVASITKPFPDTGRK